MNKIDQACWAAGIVMWIFVISAFVWEGCSSETRVQVRSTTQETGAIDTTWHSVGRGGAARMFTLNGVRCVVLDDFEGNGLSCDWRSPTTLEAPDDTL